MHWQLVAALASGILGLVMNNFPVELENLWEQRKKIM